MSAEYLKRTIELCKNNDIEVLLIDTGYDVSPESKLFAMSIADIAEQYNVNYIDFTEEDIINFEVDLYSTGENTHVNHSGAEKFSKFLGEYISCNYELEDHRSETAYSNWWLDYDSFADSKIEFLKSQSSISNYVMFLMDDYYAIAIEIRDISVLQDEHFGAQLVDLGVDLESLTDNNLIFLNNSSDDIYYGYNQDVETADFNKIRITVYNAVTAEVIDEKIF